jgi:hypothetical protein
MRCQKATFLLQLYLDHQLTLQQTRALEAHIASCSECRTDLQILEQVACGLNTLKFIPEPANLHEQIMQRVALNAARQQQVQTKNRQRAETFSPFRPSLAEILAAVVLATLATLVFLLNQPAIHALLPVTNSHDPVSVFYTQASNMLTSMNANELFLFLSVAGTLVGILITLAFAGNEVRTLWFRAVTERMPSRS